MFPRIARICTRPRKPPKPPGEAEGDLIFLWAGADIDPGHAGAIDYLLDQVLDLDRIQDGVVIVNAPDDALFDLAVSTGRAIFALQLSQLRQDAELHRLTGK